MVEPMDKSKRERRLGEIVLAYLEAADRGEAPSQAEWLASYPEFAAELAEFFADAARVDSLAVSLRSRTHSSAGGLGSTATIDFQGPGPKGTRPSSRLQKVFGDYELQDVLGRGGMGVVYRARQKSLNRPVALKMIRAGLLASPTMVERFRNEAEVTATLDHPHILPIYDVGEHEGQPYFTLKLVEGGSLASQLNRYRDNPRGAAQLVRILAEAVHHAHQHGILHRDLKPSNIVLDHEGRPYITDFGLARHMQRLTDLTPTGDLLGTPAYLAPEQITGRSADLTTATDVYGLGAILYSLLTGRPPFQEATILATLRRVVDRDPEPPAASNRLVDRDLQTICLKCLEKDPSHRYGSAAELAEELGCWLEGRSIRARSIGPTGKFWRWCKRYPIATALGLTAWLLLIAVVVTLAVSNVRMSRARQEIEAQRSRAVRESREAVRQRDAAAYDRYLAQMRLAASDWQAGQMARLEETLDAQIPSPAQPDFRNWLWYYLLAQCHHEQDTLRGHTAAVRSVSWSPDGRQLAAAGDDHTVRIWEAGSEEPRAPSQNSTAGSRGFEHGSGTSSVLRGHFAHVTSVDWSPDGKRLASGGADSVIRIWDAQTAKQIDMLPGHLRDNVRWVLWGADGQRLISTTEEVVKIWDVAQRKELYAAEGGLSGFRPGAFRSGTQQFAWASLDGIVRCCDTTSGQETAVYTIRPPGAGILVSWGPEGRLRAAVCLSDDLRIVDPTSSEVVSTLHGCTAQGPAADWSPDGQWLAALRGEVITIWDVEKKRPVLSLRGHVGGVAGEIAWCPDGHRLATAGLDATVKLWDLAELPELPPIAAHRTFVTALVWAPDSRRLASAGADGTAVIWDAATGERLRTVYQGPLALRSLAWSPDGSAVAIGLPSGIIVRHAERDEEVVPSHNASIGGLAWSPDGRFLAAADMGTPPGIDVREVPSGRRVARLQVRHAQLHALAWSPDGRLLVTGGNFGPLHLWDTANWQKLTSPPGYHASRVPALAFSPKGDLLASGGTDRTVRIWDVASRQEVATLRGHNDNVWAVAWSPDSQRLVSASDDGTLRIWDAATGREVVALGQHATALHAVAWSPDGRKLASGGADGTIKIWDASRGYELASHPARVRDRRFAQAVHSVASGVYAPAIATFQQLAESEPQQAVYREAWAHAYVQRAIKSSKQQPTGADYARILADLNAALRLVPQHSLALLGRAEVHCLRGELELALADAANAAALPDIDPRAASGLAWHLANHADAKLRSLADGLKWAQKAVDLAPYSGTIRNTLGVVQYRAGQWAEALATLEKSMELQGGGDSYDWFFVAMAHAQLAHREEARRWYDKAVEWMRQHRPQDEELLRFGAEAAEVISSRRGSGS